MTLQKSLATCLTGALISLCAFPSAHGQLTLKPLPAQGQFRDAAVDTTHGRLFVSVYDRDAVWSLDTETGRIATKIDVGDGPASMAMDDEFLAVTNRLGNSVTLIRLADLDIPTTVETGEGPGAIVALGDGRFAVANTFSDTLSIIDTRGSITVETLEQSPSVPIDLAITDTFLIAIGRGSSDAQLYNLPALTPARTIALPEIVTHAAGLEGDRFAVASDETLYIVDSVSGTVIKQAKVPVNDLAAVDGTLHVASDQAYRWFDSNLTPIDDLSLEGAFERIEVAGPVVALLDPAAGSILVAGLDSLRPAATTTAPTTTATATQPDAPEEAGDIVVTEAQPVPEERPSSDDAAPLKAMPEPEERGTIADAEPEMAPETTPEAEPETTPEMAQDGSVAVADADETAGPRERVRRNPIVTEGVRAPSLSRPSASPLQQLSRRTITDALVQPTEFGSTKGGFEVPDLTQDLENITFDTAASQGDDSTVFTQFRAELGDMRMQSKTFSHDRAPVEVHAEGDVLITQQSSTIRADEIHFRLDEPAAGEETPPVIGNGPDEEGPSLDSGHLTLKNAEIIEPTREMTADYIEYNFETGQGELKNARGQAGIYYFSAEDLHLHGPQTLRGENVWVTTCDRPHPHYKLRLSEIELVDGQPVAGSNARLQLGKADTPLYLPRWRRGSFGGSPWNIDFDSGRQAEIGYYVNVGQQYDLSPDVALGPRLFVTEKEGVGFGADLRYDFMENPASRLYRTQGETHALYTTDDRGYVHWYHRYEYSNDLVVRAQVEHWGDETFYKEFYYDTYRDRSQPRSFVNVTYRQPNYIATGTVRPQTHGWFTETEQAPEATFHLLERPIAENLYFSFDTANGYYNREPDGVGGGRSASTARLTYNWDPHPAIAITPFWEVEGNYYTRDRSRHNATGNLSTSLGVTAQTRLHRTYGGRWGFSAFKHVIVPSITYSYRPDTSVDPLDIPQYDPLDSIFGRSRVESKLSNIFYGRDAETGDVWQVGRITLYQGNDLRNERRATEDYEIEIDIRPRAWWGLQVVGERQVTSDEDNSLSEYSLARNFPALYESVNNLFGRDVSGDFSGRYGDYNRILSQLYYDGAPLGKKLSGRVGFSYTETKGEVFNREAIYGLGYRFSDKWGVGFEHTFDFEDHDLRTQTYELRRSLHCWETAIRFRDRESGFDINFEFNIKAFPGSRLKL